MKRRLEVMVTRKLMEAGSSLIHWMNTLITSKKLQCQNNDQKVNDLRKNWG